MPRVFALRVLPPPPFRRALRALIACPLRTHTSATSPSSPTSTTARSTLADRLLETTGTITDREKQDQFLDNMDLERERGITIKAQAVRMHYARQRRQGLRPQPHRHPRPRRLRLRGLALAGRLRGRAAGGRRHAGRRGADAGQRLPGARPRPRDHPGHQQDRPALRRRRPAPRQQIEEVIGLDASRRRPRLAPRRAWASSEILEAIVLQIPPPKGDPEGPLKALIFDSWYDSYRGVVMLVRVLEGTLRTKQKILLWSNQPRVRGAGARRSRPQGARRCRS